ncbi:MAG: hypothetical protein EOO41_03725, partial [Methanobacteriota archaeon]
MVDNAKILEVRARTLPSTPLGALASPATRAGHAGSNFVRMWPATPMSVRGTAAGYMAGAALLSPGGGRSGAQAVAAALARGYSDTDTEEEAAALQQVRALLRQVPNAISLRTGTVVSSSGAGSSTWAAGNWRRNAGGSAPPGMGTSSTLAAVYGGGSALDGQLSTEATLDDVGAHAQNPYYVVLCNEVTRYNTLLRGMRSSLLDLQEALTGNAAMDETLEGLQAAITEASVPAAWLKATYTLPKPLTLWMEEFVARVDFFREWASASTPTQCELPQPCMLHAFLSPRALLTAVLQAFARARSVQLNDVCIQTRVLTPAECAALGVASASDVPTHATAAVVASQEEQEEEGRGSDVEARTPAAVSEEAGGSESGRDVTLAASDLPPGGVLVSGLYVEGASWNSEAHCLVDAREEQVLASLPTVYLYPALCAPPPSGAASPPALPSTARPDAVATARRGRAVLGNAG